MPMQHNRQSTIDEIKTIRTIELTDVFEKCRPKYHSISISPLEEYAGMAKIDAPYKR